MPKIVPKDELLKMKGWRSSPSDYFEIDQERIDRFAEVTEDRQFIHSDPERAAQTPFGGTIAHGFLTLSLLSRLVRDIYVIPEGTVMVVNYGLDKVRFIEPVPSGGRVRAHLEILDVVEKDRGRILVTSKVTIAIAGHDKPALIAESLVLFVTQ
ncbi:MAG: MaoC family dehydratase [Acidobacteria bacterium]|nr:MaoC family dehydratase [Acidobacteriota bacterium]